MKRFALALAFNCALFIVHCSLVSARQVITLSDGWGYKPQSDTRKTTQLTPVTLPHTWNAEYVKGTTHYNREMMNYQRTLNVTEEMKKQRMFLYFEGVNSVADVIINGKTVGNHKGGYTAFCFEITNFVNVGDNLLEVWVSNAYRTDVLPISGDFNVYGGIHRPCHLILTSQNCIAPDFYASPGVIIKQNKVTEEMADITVETHITTQLSPSGGRDWVSLLATTRGLSRQRSPLERGFSLRISVIDATGKLIASKDEQSLPLGGDGRGLVSSKFSIKNPHLWNGKKDPYLYTVKAELMKDGKTIDEVSQQTGFRYFSVDKEKGFYLNGEYLNLYGFCRHEDVEGKGSALVQSDYDKDMEIILESGATGMRLAHYPHGEPMYNNADKAGICLWTELPLVGPGGYKYAGFINNEGLKDNARQVLKELVYQKYNHPSIIFWGLFNELLVNYDHPRDFITELNKMFKELDPSRLTCFATCVDQQEYLGVSDLAAWNKYFGWYADEAGEDKAGTFFDNCYATSGKYPVGLSEYGAGAGAHTYMWPMRKGFDKNRIHPQEKQCMNHEQNWNSYGKRQYLWCKFIWQFADMQSSIRNEGERDGMNDKGLVSYDRTIKKDAFYFYKANWRKDIPVLYISEHEYLNRTEADQQVKVYTNLSEVTLYINDKKIGKIKTDNLCRAHWPHITLQEGCNDIRVEGKYKGKKVIDVCRWELTTN